MHPTNIRDMQFCVVRRRKQCIHAAESIEKLSFVKVWPHERDPWAPKNCTVARFVGIFDHPPGNFFSRGKKT